MEKIIPISLLQTSAKKYVDLVRDTDEPVVITQRGRPAAVLVSYEEFEGVWITKDEMSYPDWKKRYARAEKELREGKGQSLESYLRERKKRR